MENDNNIVQRDVPEIDPARARLVERKTAEITEARRRWQPTYDRMRADMRFAAGAQWPGQKVGDISDHDYVVNIVHRHITQRVASLYGRNPKVIARKRPRLMSSIWDGTNRSLQEAQQLLVQNPFDSYARTVIDEANAVRQHDRIIDRIARSLELLYAHDLGEQSVPFKQSMKETIRRAATTGVGWVKIGFQRVMRPNPDAERQIADAQERLSTLERLAADLADGVMRDDSAEIEQLRLLLQDLSRQREIVTREGLTYDFPESDAIIPDPRCRSLRGFVGCDWVAEQYLLSPQQVQELYGVDVSKSYHSHTAPHLKDAGRTHNHDIVTSLNKSGDVEDGSLVCVWQQYCRSDGLVYVIADGYPDFLTEPASPEVEIEGFWPWRAVMWNEVYLPGEPWPRSDVELLRPMQMEINRSRQAQREHRAALAPLMVTTASALNEDDREKLNSHAPVALVELNALKEGESVERLFQSVKKPSIDPNNYSTAEAERDILRAVGTQEANLGGTSSATATESSIAEASRVTAADATVDDIDTMLSDLARIGSQILLLHVTKATVQRVVGPGAAWPEASRRDVMDELFLDVEAGSAGIPHQQIELARWTQALPILSQLPNISPEWLARELLSRLGVDVDLSEAFVEGMPSVHAQNQMQARMIAQQVAGMAPGDPGSDPTMQGQQGAMNAPAMSAGQGGPGPRVPEPRDNLGAVGGQAMVN